MTGTDALRFALRSLTGFRVRSALTLAAMAIGVASVVILTTLGEGARQYVISEFSSLGSHLLIVFPGRTETRGGAPPAAGESPRDLTLDDALALLRSPLVTRVSPINVGAALISWGGREREGVVLGTNAEYAAMRDMQLAQGRFLPPGDPRQASPVCVLGAKMRDELFGPHQALGEWVRIGERRFRVMGVLAPSGQSLLANLDEVAIIPVASAQMLFNTPSLFRIVVETRGPEALSRAKQAVTEIIARRHEGEEDVTVMTLQAMMDTFDRILTALTFTVGGIAAISLVVAGILVMNVMLVAVSQRVAEIGLLKALGASSGTVMTLFLAEAGVLSLAGAGAGLIIGLAGTWFIGTLYPALSTVPPAWAVAAAVGVALSTGLVFGVQPARRAARLDPVQALARR